MIKRSIKQSIKVPVGGSVSSAPTTAASKFGIIIKGGLPPYEALSRNSLGFNGDGTTAAIDGPMYEHVDSTKVFRH